MSYFIVCCILGFVRFGFFVFRFRYSRVDIGYDVILILLVFDSVVRLLGFRLCVVLVLLFFSNSCCVDVLGMWCSIMCFIGYGVWYLLKCCSMMVLFGVYLMSWYGFEFVLLVCS